MEPFYGEIRMFAGNYPPSGWAMCNGQLLTINSNPALYSLLGTQFGGDGKVTFGLPNLQCAVVVGSGQGPGLTLRTAGNTGGAPSVTLDPTQMPTHSHAPNCDPTASQASPENALWAATGRGAAAAYAPWPSDAMKLTRIAQANVEVVGQGQSHNNMQVYQTLSFIICVENGIYPTKP